MQKDITSGLIFHIHGKENPTDFYVHAVYI